MGIKRWGFVILAGTVLIVLGFSQVLTARRISNVITRLTAPDFLLIALGLLLMGVGVVLLIRSLLVALVPEQKGDLSEVLWRNRVRQRGPRIVVFGGGTGLPVLLKGLKNYTTNLTAVVTVADDGGSSGRLRRDLEVPPPGDLRNCLVALARSEDLMSRLFQYRFERGGDLVGHSFGNLLIAALANITGDFMQALKVSSDVLAVVGEVLPSTCQNVVLRAVLMDGQRVEGETNISKSGKRIREISLFPSDPVPPPSVLERIEQAEIIVLGPGSLFTSVIPNLLVPDIATAILQTGAPVVYVSNIMTQPGETDRFNLSDHLEAIFHHTAIKKVDHVIVNSGHISDERQSSYRAKGSTVVEIDAQARSRMGATIVAEDIVTRTDFIRHDSTMLAQSLMKLVEMRMSRGVRVLRARR